MHLNACKHTVINLRELRTELKWVEEKHSTELLNSILKMCDSHIRYEFLKVVNVKAVVFICLIESPNIAVFRNEVVIISLKIVVQAEVWTFKYEALFEVSGCNVCMCIW